MRNSSTGKSFRCVLQDTGGATVIEYALIACGVSIAILSAVTAVGDTVMTAFYDSMVSLF
jgi:Flp pilus assembly pilin Flp